MSESSCGAELQDSWGMTMQPVCPCRPWAEASISISQFTKYFWLFVYLSPDTYDYSRVSMALWGNMQISYYPNTSYYYYGQVCYPHLMDEVRLSDWTKVAKPSDQAGCKSCFSQLPICQSLHHARPLPVRLSASRMMLYPFLSLSHSIPIPLGANWTGWWRRSWHLVSSRKPWLE